MSVTGNISFKVSQSSSSNGNAVQATVHSIGGTMINSAPHQKYMVDIIAHALSKMGMDIENDRFTYTFPFRLR